MCVYTHANEHIIQDVLSVVNGWNSPGFQVKKGILYTCYLLTGIAKDESGIIFM